MVVLSLFDGISCGRLALQRASIKVDKYFASEIDKDAIKVTMNNFPDTIQIGDVYNVHYKDGKLITDNGTFEVHIDLLIGGSACFTSGNLVLTEDGYKEIENVEIGDKVLTHKGRWKKVTDKFMRQSNDLWKIKAQGTVETIGTGNHPFYIRNMGRKWSTESDSYKRVFSEPSWTKLSEVGESAFVGYPMVNVEENPENLTKEECWLLGRYVADGFVRDEKRSGRKNSYHHLVTFCIGRDKAEEFEAHVTSYYAGKYEARTAYNYRIINERFMKLCRRCGKGAINKCVPSFILNLPVDLLREFIEGYMSGDGCFTNGKHNANSISSKLIFGLQAAVHKAYKVAGNIHYVKRPSTYIIEGRTVNQHDTYMIRYLDTIPKQSKAVLLEDGIWMPVKEVEKLEVESPQTVYNLEVEDDHTYIVNGMIVHNCQNLCLGGDNLGLKGAKSSIFFEFLRLRDEIKPKYWLLENVKCANKHRDAISQYLGVNPILIDSALVSYQHRRRYYWSNMKFGQPEDKHINFQDYIDLTIGPDDVTMFSKSPCNVKAYNMTINNEKTKYKYKDVTNEDKTATILCKKDRPTSSVVMCNSFMRSLTRTELERAQTLPIGYTDGLTYHQAHKVIGNGWTVDVIAHILKEGITNG